MRIAKLFLFHCRERGKDSLLFQGGVRNGSWCYGSRKPTHFSTMGKHGGRCFRQKLQKNDDNDPNREELLNLFKLVLVIYNVRPPGTSSWASWTS